MNEINKIKEKLNTYVFLKYTAILSLAIGLAHLLEHLWLDAIYFLFVAYIINKLNEKYVKEVEED